MFDLLGPAIERRLLLHAFRVDVPPKLRRNHNLIAEGLDRLADDLFIHPWPVNLRCVEEGNSAVVCRTYQLDAVFFVEPGRALPRS